MDFSFDETQRAVSTLAADVLLREVDSNAAPPPASTRAGPATSSWDETVWKAMAEAGLLALAVPVDLGGDGLGVLETAAVLTEVGRHAATVPALATLALGVLPVARFGTAAQRAALLPPVAAGTAILTAGTNEPSAPMSPRPATAARTDGTAYRLTGVKIAVPHAAAAQRILVPATVSDAGVGVFLVEPTADGVTLTRTPSSSGMPEYTLRLADTAGELLGADLGGQTATGLYQHAAAGACATAAGVVDGALSLTAEHLRTREQFGRPLATFQAVAQQVAEVYGTARTLRLAALSSCWRLATDRDAAADLDVAMHWVAAEALPALHTCQHLHGGLGVDIGYPLHRFYSWAKDLARFVGGSGATLDRLGARIAE